MIAFLAAALAEILVGVFVCVVYRPGRRAAFPWRYLGEYHDISAAITDSMVVKKANLFVLRVCIFSALATLGNGLMHVYRGMVDVKEVLLVATILAVIPLRCVHIARNEK